MSLKVLIILSLIAAAAAGPTPTGLFPLLPNLNLGLNGILNIGTSPIGSAISTLFRGLIGDKRVARTTGLEAILSLKVKDFGGVCELVSRIVISLSDTIEASIKGLGVLISRLVICLLRIIICLLGNGGNNPVCSNSINALLGVSTSVSVDITTCIKQFGLWNVKADFEYILRIFTRGRGISACRNGVGVVFTITQYWVNLLHGHISGVRLITKADLSIVLEKVSILLGLFGNTRNAGSGITILKNFIPLCNKYLVPAGYNVIGNEDVIVASCNQGNNDIYSPWAISDVDISASVSLGGILNLVFRGLNGVTRLATTLLQDIANFVLRTVDDVFTLVIRIVLGLGGVLDATISGLGTLLVRIVAGLLKIILCFIGKGNYGICRPGWDRTVGVYDDVTSIEVLIQLYGLVGVTDKINAYVNIYTNGQGYGALKGSVKNVVTSCRNLGAIIDAKRWEKEVVITVVKEVSVCVGSIGNSNSKGVGTAVCKKLIPDFDKLLAGAGFVGLGKVTVGIDVSIDLASNDDTTWSAGVDLGENKPGAGFIDIGVGVGVDVSVGGSGSGSGGGLIGGLIKGIFGTIKGVGQLAVNALKTILNIKIQALKDVFTLITNLSLVVQVSLDNLVIGLGSLLTRLIGVIIKIAVCVKGYPGDRGICNKGWNEKWGYTGDSDTVAGLILVFNLGNARNEYNDYVYRCTNGKGIGSAKPSVRSTLEQIGLLIDIVLNADSLTKDHVTKAFVSLTIISGCIGNSQKKDSGKDLAQQVVTGCSKYLSGAGYIDISVQISVIINECSKSNNDNVDWNGGYNTSPAPGGGTTPSTGSGTTPSTGGGSTPSPGGGSTPSGGDDTDSTPSGGYTTESTPSGGDSTGTTPSGGDYTDSTPSGGGSTPSGGDDTDSTPSGGYSTDSTPSGGGSTPSGGDDTDSTPSGGYSTDSTPSGGGSGTTPSDSTGTTPENVTGTTPTFDDTTTQSGYDTPAPGGGSTPSPGGGSTPSPGGGSTPSPGGGSTPSPGGGSTPSPGGDTNGDNCGAVIAGGIQVIPGVTKFNINIIQELISLKIRTDLDVINLVCKLTLALGGVIDLIVTGLGSILSRLVAVFFKILYCVKGYGSSRAICNKEWNALYGVNGEATSEKDLLALFRVTNSNNDCKDLIGSYKGQVTGVVKVIFDIVTSLSASISAGVTKEYFVTVISSTFTVFASVTNSYSKGTGTIIIRKVLPVCSPYLVRQGFADISAKVNVIVSTSVVGDSDRIDWKALQVISSKADQAVANIKDVITGVKDNKNVNLASLTAVLNLELPFNFDGVLSFAIKVVLALGGIIDVFISGLGSLLIRIVGFLIYYIVAVLGGARNVNSFVSQKAYFASFASVGVSVITGNTWGELLTGWKLDNCQSDYNAIVSKYTNGKGIVVLKGALKLFFTAVEALIAIVLKAEKILAAELSVIIRIVITLLGGFANSCQANLGNKIIEIFVSVCSSFLVKSSYPVINVSVVAAAANECNNVVAPWSTQITTTVVEN